METQQEYYYTYYSYEEWGRGYIGSRGCKCLPEEDVKYFGSCKDKNFKPTKKIILNNDYATREEAYADEIILQQYYKIVENPHFANKAYQTSTKFYVPREQAIENGKINMQKQKELGIGVYALSSEQIIEKNKKIGEKNKGKVRSDECRRKRSEKMKGEKNHRYGKSHSKETREKISKSRKGIVYSRETIEKISKLNMGKKHSNETKRKQSESSKGKNNPFYGKSHSEETKRKLSEASKGENNPAFGKKWWNDGCGNVKRCIECPGDGWVLGRGKKVVS